MYMKSGFKNDRYKKTRGNYSRLLEINCESCGEFICYYQKDGPGILKRMYLDRISGSKTFAELQNLSIDNIPSFDCPKCNKTIGNLIVYKKEDRLAYRLFVGSITKKIIKAH